MPHKMLTQRALFCIDCNTKKGMLRQKSVTHVAPPLGLKYGPWVWMWTPNYFTLLYRGVALFTFAIVMAAILESKMY